MMMKYNVSVLSAPLPSQKDLKRCLQDLIRTKSQKKDECFSGCNQAREAISFGCLKTSSCIFVLSAGFAFYIFRHDSDCPTWRSRGIWYSLPGGTNVEWKSTKSKNMFHCQWNKRGSCQNSKYASRYHKFYCKCLNTTNADIMSFF